MNVNLINKINDFNNVQLDAFFTPKDYARPTHPASKGLDDVIHQ